MILLYTHYSLGKLLFGNGGIFWIFLVVVFVIGIGYYGISRGIENEKKLSRPMRIIISVLCTLIIIAMVIYFIVTI